MIHPLLLTLYEQGVQHRLIGAWTLPRIRPPATQQSYIERLALMAHAAILDHDLRDWQPQAPRHPAHYRLRARRIDDRRYIDQGFHKIFAAKHFLNLLTHDTKVRWQTPLQIITPDLLITAATDNLEEIADYRLTASERAFIFPAPYLQIYTQFITAKK